MSTSSGDEIWGLYYLLLTGVLNDAAPAIDTLGLEMKEYFTLANVEKCPYPAELADRLAVPRATMTGYLKSLEARELITRRLDPGDMRRHRLELTDEGRGSVQRAGAIISRVFDDRLVRLADRERVLLRDLLEKLCC